MKRLILLPTALLILCLLCSCGAVEPGPINEGETYLDGAWYLDDAGLQIGYSFFPEGRGFLFIGETVVPIRYGISGEYLYVSDNGAVEEHAFLATEDGLRIDGLLFLPVEEDPNAAASVEAMLSEAMQQEPASDLSDTSPQAGERILQLITLAAAVGVVVILVQFLRKRRKNS